MIRKLIRKLAWHYGITTDNRTDLIAEENNRRLDDLESRIDKAEEAAEDIERIYKEAVEINHRLKKLEDYLVVEYVTEVPPPVFIGYRPKKK